MATERKQSGRITKGLAAAGGTAAVDGAAAAGGRTVTAGSTACRALTLTLQGSAMRTRSILSEGECVSRAQAALRPSKLRPGAVLCASVCEVAEREGLYPTLEARVHIWPEAALRVGGCLWRRGQ